MKFLYKLIILSCIFFSIPSYAQIKGKCIDIFGKGVAYVNISVKGKPIGTVSNQKGEFFLKHPSIKKNDSLIFSHLNYNKKIVLTHLSFKEIELTPKVEALEEIVISNKKRKIKIVGTKIENRGDSKIFIRSHNLGAENGKIIKVKKNKIYDIKNVQFTIETFGFKSAKFRINFYNIKDGVVDLEKINRTDFIYKIIGSGIIKIDLSKQQLSFRNNFLVSIEWIDFVNDDDLEEGWKRIDIPLAYNNGPMCYRKNVHRKWRIHKVKNNLGMGIHLEVEQYSQ